MTTRHPTGQRHFLYWTGFPEPRDPIGACRSDRNGLFRPKLRESLARSATKLPRPPRATVLPRPLHSSSRQWPPRKIAMLSRSWDGRYRQPLGASRVKSQVGLNLHACGVDAEDLVDEPLAPGYSSGELNVAFLVARNNGQWTGGNMRRRNGLRVWRGEQCIAKEA